MKLGSFLALLLRDIGSHEDKGWVFISGRQKGLLEAVSKLAPQAKHRFCLRHMYNNFKGRYKGQELKNVFWKAASTCNVRQHRRTMREIQRIPPKRGSEVTTYEWLCNIPSTHWARCFFPVSTKWDVIVNNISESFTSYILEARELPIIEKFEAIRKKFINKLKLETDDHVDDCFKKDRYLRVYSHMVNPVPGIHDYEESTLGIVNPPNVKTGLGRPKKKRMRDGNDRGPLPTGQPSPNVPPADEDNENRGPSQIPSQTEVPMKSFDFNVFSDFEIPSQTDVPMESINLSDYFEV
ncbi:hypothetical protein BUALT_Bualt02G0092500 [Buddleja alternifolia]|uniref:MULE transposase domain-containing protein n=1 Tax=Buddleja alternifolia TaxID=168488 RepID=A0AAV6Y9D9_9LAMI|nr:hypothetical protein BUALT_Bualt02G0092500 [Buddleja alternifolia]